MLYEKWEKEKQVDLMNQRNIQHTKSLKKSGGYALFLLAHRNR